MTDTAEGFVKCPACEGRREEFAGLRDGEAIMKPCQVCDGLGSVKRDHPDVEIRDCPHGCGAKIRIEQLSEGEALGCPGCGEPFKVEFDGELEAISWDQVEF